VHSNESRRRGKPALTKCTLRRALCVLLPHPIAPPSGDAERAEKGRTGGHDANDGDNAPTDGDDDDVNMEE
jgi:hypothetical protein